MTKSILLSCLLALSIVSLQAQDLPVVVEAESGNVGSDWEITTETGISFVRNRTNLISGNYPGSNEKVITYTVTFPRAGVYDLYARIRIGAGAANDDSYFYARSFGVNTSTADNNEWITANNLHNKGYIDFEPNAVVDGAGAYGTRVWKWINMSEFNGGEAPVSFTVPEGALTQTFQIGGREDGLEFDKFLFGLADKYFTVTILNKRQPGLDSKPAPFIPSGKPLANGLPKYLGNVYSATGTQTPYFTNYWNQVAPGNGGKWGVIEGKRDVMNWGELDAAYKLAKDNGFPFRMHVLIWGNQQPSWIENLPPAEQLEEIQEWFQAVAERYPELELIEVVNEPINDPPSSPGNGGGNYINALGGTGTTGYDWIMNAFRLARQYFPNAKLMMNEYNLESSTARTEQYVQIINLLKAENLIDAVGTQAHAFSTRGSAASIKANLDRMAATNLPLYVTEMDIDGVNENGELDDQVQLEDYKRLFPVFWEHPAIKGITFAGWKPGMWRTAQGAFLAYTDGVERPALVWLREYVESNTNVHVPVVTPNQSFSLAGITTCNILGTVAATDADANTTLHGWQITGGTGAAIFSLSAATGQISIARPELVDFSQTVYSLTVKVNDGFSTSAGETVTITIPEKIYVVHNGLALHIAKESVPDHLAHGDCIGKDATTAELASASTVSSLKEKETASDAVTVYPNPSAEGRFTIEVSQFDATNKPVYQIIDAGGRKLVEQQMNSNTSSNSLNLKPGIYFIRLVSIHEVTVRKVIVQ